MAATFRAVFPLGYTFGVLAFLRSLQGGRLGWEERDRGREWEVDGRNFPFCCSGGVYFRSSRIFEVPPGVGAWAGGGEGWGTGVGSGWPQLLVLLFRWGKLSEISHF